MTLECEDKMVRDEMANKEHVYNKQSCICPELLPVRAFTLLSFIF